MDEETAEFARRFEEFTRVMAEAASFGRTSPVRDLLEHHLRADPESVPVISESFSSYDHVNAQVAMSAYVEQEGRTHQLVGLTGQQRHYGSLSDILEMARHGATRLGPVDLVNLANGPDTTMPCVQFGFYLINEPTGPFVVLMRGPGDHTPQPSVSLEVLSPNERQARDFLNRIRTLMVELNVFRAQVVAFGQSHMGHQAVGPIAFLHRPEMAREQLVLGEGVLEGIEREVLGIARHRDRLRASGQHVKRGLLLHGPPGTGKTHTVRYLVSQAREHTVVLMAGGGLGWITTACALARLLQPALVILEDVDLVAHDRSMHTDGFGNPLLFNVLNEMDGMAEDADVAFLLTTNRADLLEPALAARPGRVDLAVHVGLPDDDARRRLLHLYGSGLDLRLDHLDRVVKRTAGVTASFIKELMRKSALGAASEGDGSGRIAVTDADVEMALDELLAERSELTRVLLGGDSRHPQPEEWLDS
ncbi:MAG TPA: ATP-binding protein [Actinomycetota bacterium]|nr:ATP-binding protein [Actinomycetota bacterium]